MQVEVDSCWRRQRAVAVFRSDEEGRRIETSSMVSGLLRKYELSCLRLALMSSAHGLVREVAGKVTRGLRGSFVGSPKSRKVWAVLKTNVR